MSINSYIDHTILKPTTTIAEIKTLCGEALQYNFAAVCVPPPLVKNARQYLSGTAVKTATVIGFPFGYSTVHAKKAEIVQAIKDEADELDVVINLIALRNNAWKYLESEVKQMMELIKKQEKVIKVIIESGILTDDEIVRCCELYGKEGVDFLKTSTGYADKGASVKAVELMRKELPDNIKIKASGGIRTFDFAKELIHAGAVRLGCSASVAIVNGEREAGGLY
jgi:deoxyribose-phosphate aldolase